MNLRCRAGWHEKDNNNHEGQRHNGLHWFFYICPACQTRFGGFAPREWNDFRTAWESERNNVPDGNKRRREYNARVDARFAKFE